jgi:hypothetical protein
MSQIRIFLHCHCHSLTAMMTCRTMHRGLD